MRSVLFGGPWDRRELDIPEGTEKISLPISKDQPEMYLTWESRGIRVDARGPHLAFHLDEKSGGSPERLLVGR